MTRPTPSPSGMVAGLTEREIACLRLLNDRMDATPEQIGAAVLPGGGRSKRGRVTVGNRIADGLWDRLPPLVGFVSSKVGYAITPAGRAALAQTAAPSPDQKPETGGAR